MTFAAVSERRDERGFEAAPGAERFPAAPPSWYLVGHASSLRDAPVSRRIGGRRLVFFRDGAGTLRALDAHCSHMGADLGRGNVVDGCLQCPFHGWVYGSDGRCRDLPSGGAIPSFARQSVYPVAERAGCVFVFNEKDADFPLPFFDSVPPEGLAGGRPFVHRGPWPWYAAVANGFDSQHMATVHDRRLLAEPEIDEPSPFARRIRYRTEVCGTSLADRFLRRCVGPVVDVTITVQGGTLAWVEARFARATSYLLIAFDPRDEGGTRVAVVPFQRRTRLARTPAGSVLLALRRRLTIAFLEGDLTRLDTVVYRPERMIEADRPLIDFYRWLAALSTRRK